MKTHTLPAIAFLSTVAALLLLPVGAAAAASALTVAGTVLLFMADYGREVRPLAVQGQILAFQASCPDTHERQAA